MKMPGPGFLDRLKAARQFQTNYLVPVENLFKTYGNYVDFPTYKGPLIFAFHPDAVEHVLRTNQKNYVKRDEMKELKPLLGNGLLTSEGETWREHRKLIAPEFQHKRVETFFPMIDQHLRILLDQWQTVAPIRDICPSISQMTYAIAAQVFFGAKVTGTSSQVYQSIDLSSEIAVRRMASIFKWPRWVPTRENRKLNQIVAAMDKIVYDIIDNHDKTDRPDVLSRLLPTGMKREAIRDEVMTLLLAGHETTANALSWTLFLLAQNPDIQEELYAELAREISNQTATYEEIKKLSFTKMVFEESMRLYPPAAVIGRKSIQGDVIGGYPITKDTGVHLSQWVTHRHPDFWEDPLQFKPERFATPHKHHPFAYFPFASGSRECVGKNMAMLEGVALLAGIIKNYRFEWSPSNPVTIRPLVTLRPHPGVLLKIQPRHKKVAFTNAVDSTLSY